jgi:hypothetical protein
MRNSSYVLNFNIPLGIDSSASVQDLLEHIIKRVMEERSNIIHELKIYFDYPKLMTFLVVNKKTGIEEKLKLQDTLYSNNYIRNADTKSQLDIIFRLESPDEMSRNDKEVIMKSSGYAKYRSGNQFYQWRQCKIKPHHFNSI